MIITALRFAILGGDLYHGMMKKIYVVLASLVKADLIRWPGEKKTLKAVRNDLGFLSLR